MLEPRAQVEEARHIERTALLVAHLEVDPHVSQHRDAGRHGVTRLVWFEGHGSIESAIQRETSIKRWPRQWKLNLIEQNNPDWRDLYDDLVRMPELPDWAK